MSAAKRHRGTRQFRPKGWTALVLASLLAGGGFLVHRSQRAPIPQIDTSGLEPLAAQLIENVLREVRAQPRSAPAWGKLGALLRSFELRQPALACLRQAERLAPEDPRWPYLQVSLLEPLSVSDALTQARRAATLSANTPAHPRLQLGRLLMEQGQRAEARQHFEALLADQPELGPARLGLAQLAQAEGQWDHAMTLAQTCTTNPYTARAAWTLVSAVQFRRGQTNAALMASRMAANVTADVRFPDPFEAEFQQLRGDARGLSDQAQEALVAGRPNDAAPRIQRLVRDHPQFPETWLLQGRMFFLEKNIPAAEQALRRHLQLDPQSVNGHFQLGMCFLGSQRYADAITTFQNVLELKPSFGPAHFNLAFALAKSGNKTEAVPHFQEAIRHNPEQIDSYILLADLLLQLGQTADAIHWATQGQSLSPSDPRLPALLDKIQRMRR